MARFFLTHPEWRNTSAVTGRFHWKWYYAMHQAGDDAVAPQLAAYRQGMNERERWTRRAGVLLASVNVQVLLHRLADSDLEAQLAFHDRVTAFHTRLRHFYYPYIFEERSFGPAQFAAMPAYEAAPVRPNMPLMPLACLFVLAMIAGWAGLREASRQSADVTGTGQSQPASPLAA
jgi:ABC-2 type transport system permease protein